MAKEIEDPLAKSPQTEHDPQYTYLLETDTISGGRNRKLFSRSSFFGALTINFITFLLPALYGTLSKLWIANIDSSVVATTDSYTYASTVTEVINEGLPRAAYLIIGNRAGRTLQDRLTLSSTLLVFQMVLGLILSLCFIGAAKEFANAFVPASIASESVQYVRIGAFGSFFGATSTALAAATRSLDRPDVPLLISSLTTLGNIVLDLCFLSTIRPARINPTVNTQAGIRLACDGIGTIAGLLYFVWTVKRLSKRSEERLQIFSGDALVILAKAGSWFFVESAVRNALYLWQVHTIVGLGADWATAFGVFNTIRWGIIMVPVSTLEVTAVVHVAHRYGQYQMQQIKRATRKDLFYIVKPALLGAGTALSIETVLCILLSVVWIFPFAHWLSGSNEVARITQEIWRSIDWCYCVGYAVSTLLATILTATKPHLYLINSLLSNLLWVLPWTIAVQVKRASMIRSGNFWTYYAIIFGGSLMFSLLTVSAMLFVWAHLLRRQARRNSGAL